MRKHLIVIAVGVLTASCATEPSSDPPFPVEPAVPLNIASLTGAWEQRFVVYVPNQGSLPMDTVAVAAAEQRRYRFGLDGPDIVRRTSPDTGQALIRFEPDGICMSWVIGNWEGNCAVVTAHTLRLQSGLTRPHRWPGDTLDRDVQFQELYLRTQ